MWYASSNSSPASATITTVRGTTVRVFYLQGTLSNNFGGFTVTIDGTLAATVSSTTATNNNETIGVETITGLSAGLHTVEVANTSTTPWFLCGVSGENASGVLVDNMGRASASTLTMTAATTYSLPKAAMTSAYPTQPDLLVVEMGANDASGNGTGSGGIGTGSVVPAATWLENMGAILTQAKGSSSKNGAMDIALIMPPIGSFDTSGYGLYSEYAQAARGLAEAFGAALIDVNVIGLNNYTYLSNMLYFGSSSNPGQSGNDPIHPGDTGSVWFYDQIKTLFTATS